MYFAPIVLKFLVIYLFLPVEGRSAVFEENVEPCPFLIEHWAGGGGEDRKEINMLTPD